MHHKDKDGVTRHVLKPTRWMSTSPFILKRLSKKCPRGSKSAGGHEHTTLFGAEKAKAAAVFSPALCKEVLLGVQEQLQAETKATNPHVGSLLRSPMPVYNLRETDKLLEVRPDDDSQHKFED